ncbi:hypothetical protein CPAR01_09152 [Colletotrichum paranaense]|uniref:Uncharacterized protein n=1 Tax=Colletotrichum paranaense TaxID=1914294 RepID=A0ABQ9SFX2_9PEZI|nr:uncharacterized protein CPAR01_09152 [Colletotrichum paranaense]KAK1535610.1 hypothetical protein CPAR01_09152 [Colletotrichum paranaense]
MVQCHCNALKKKGLHKLILSSLRPFAHLQMAPLIPLSLKLAAMRPASSFPATSLCRSAPLPSKLNSDGHHCNFNHHQAWLGAETFNSRLCSTRPMSP